MSPRSADLSVVEATATEVPLIEATSIEVHRPGLPLQETLLKASAGKRPVPNLPELSSMLSSLGLHRIWPDQLRIFIHPGHVVLVRIKRNRHKHIVHRQIMSCVAGNSHGKPWQNVLALLSTALQDVRWLGAMPQLVLSDHFVRYALIPWHASLQNRQERQAYLRHSFALAYGEAVKHWDLRMSDSNMHTVSLASGIEQALLQDIHSVFINAGFKLDAVHPHLMVAINDALPQLTQQSCYGFVLVEASMEQPGRLCMALIQDGQWRSVKSVAFDGNVELHHVELHHVELHIEQLMARESVIHGIDTAAWPLAVYWPGYSGVASPMLAGRQVSWIKPAAMPIGRQPGHDNQHRQSYSQASPQQDRQQEDQLAIYETVFWR